MPSPSIFALASMMPAVFAAPSSQTKGFLYPRAGPDDCGPTLGDQSFVADLGFYSDKDCTNKITYSCEYTFQSVIDAGAGNYGCGSGGLPSTTPFWVKVEDSPFAELQVVFTRDQTCPPNGPGAVFATLIDNSACVQFNLGGEAPGISIFPNGGSPIAKQIENSTESSGNLVKRDDPKCSGFNIESSAPSSSQTVQVSNIIDCTNGGPSGCMITVGEEHTESVSTSFSASAGGGIEGIFSVETTFGQEYTSSSTTSIQEGFSVQAGQKGYLSAYSAATLFTGTFTDCDSGDAEQPGQVLAIKGNGFTYAVINTGA